MNWVLSIVICGLVLIPSAILIPFRVRKKDFFSERQIDLSPAVRITILDGWVYLQLVNRSEVKMWIEDATLVITDLEAKFQTALAIGQMTLNISQTILPDETLSMSLTKSLYEAGGSPQGRYSFFVIGTVHYRIGEDWAQTNILPHRVKMAALNVVRVRRIHQKSTTAEAHDDQEITSGPLTQVNSSEETLKVRSVGR
jgi:hypothetical protein